MSFTHGSHNMFITVWSFISPLFSSFYSWCIQTVYTVYEHCNCLEFHWNMTYWHMLPGYSTFHQVYIRYIQHIMEIPTCHWINIIWIVLRGILISLPFITVWLYHDVYSFSLHLFFVHCVHIVLTFSHGFYVYETYTSGILIVHISPQKGT